MLPGLKSNEQIDFPTVFVCIHVLNEKKDFEKDNDVGDTFMCSECWNVKAKFGEDAVIDNIRAICKHCWNSKISA